MSYTFFKLEKLNNKVEELKTTTTTTKNVLPFTVCINTQSYFFIVLHVIFVFIRKLVTFKKIRIHNLG